MFAVVARGAAADAEPLAEAVRRAVANHPQVLAFDENRRAAHAAMGAAEGLKKPRVSLSAQTGALGAEDVLDRSAGVTLTAAQTLYDAGEARSQIRSSRADAWTAEYRLRDEILATALQTAQAYIEVQRTRRLLKVLKQNHASLKAIAGRVRERIAAGLGTEADLYQAKARLESALEKIEVAKQQNADAVAEYLALTGSEPGRLESEGAPSKALPRSVEEAVSLARAHSPTILATRYAAISAAAQSDVAAARLKPRVSLELNLDYDAAIDGYAEEAETAAAVVVFKFDLYDGGVKKARAREARHKAEAQRHNLKATQRDIERQMRLSWNAIRVSVNKLGPMQNHVRDARRAMLLHLDRYGAGLSTLDAILNLQDEVAAAEVGYLNEQSSYRFNVYRVLAATGHLLPALGVDDPTGRRLQ